MNIQYISVLFTVILSTAHCYNNDVLKMFLKKNKGEDADIHENVFGAYSGKGTFGSCGYGHVLPAVATHHKIRYLVGLSPEQYNGALGCGMCFRVRAKGEGWGKNPIMGDFIVFVNDICTDCREGDMDFAEQGGGRWAIEFLAVQCPVGQTKIEYKFQGSNLWYIKVQIRNARVPVDRVYVLRNGEAQMMKRTIDGYWKISNGRFTLPLKIKMTSVNGETIYDIIPRIENGVVLQGANYAQFQYDPRLLQS